MTRADTPALPPSLEIKRHFTREGEHPYDEITWERRTARVGKPGEPPKFEQQAVEVPNFWSQNATDIVAEKYFAYGLEDKRRESSVRQMIDRVVGAITAAGIEHGYFSEEEARIFSDELTWILVNQRGTFNSPVWFNVGVSGARPQCSACYILSVDDDLDAISRWYAEEMRIFKRGSGAGINLSNLRGSCEPLSLGGTSSGPVTFMRGPDAQAGTLKSGGATRRAAKLVCLDVDHPDITDFIWCKAHEEDRIKALQAAGFPMGLDGGIGERNLAESTSYQNANNSVRVSREFLRAVERDGDWDLIARRGGHVVKTVKARELMHEIAEAAWRCADPGVQYDTTINDWHTTPAQGPITASNPCSEFMSNDNTSCNLATLNLLAFRSNDGTFDVESFAHATRIIFTAQEITVAFGYFPTPKITENTKNFRQIGINYANLGALLMAEGLPYDSDEGRALAAAITALMTGEGYLQSTRLAERMGAFHHYAENAESMLRVIRKHRSAAKNLPASQPQLVKAARRAWDETLSRGQVHGFRNSQCSVMAPTGTVSFKLDCDTTGVEPDFSLIKTKNLAGGGQLLIPNRTLPLALRTLGYDAEQVREIVEYVREEIDHGDGAVAPRGTVVGAPHLAEEHYAVFDCAIGERAIDPMGHVRMMAAIQPLISGALSKTVNLPESTTVEEIEEIYIEGGRLGLKSLAVYRDGCKAFQPLAAAKSKSEREPEAQAAIERQLTSILGDGLLRGERRRPPREAEMRGTHFKIGQTSGYIHVHLFEDGRPGGVFIDVGNAGSTLALFIDALATAISIALQHGTPLDILVSKLAFMQGEPYGITNDPHIRQVRSIVDYIARWLALKFLDEDVHEVLGINSPRTESAEQLAGELTPALEVHSAVKPASPHKTDEVRLTSGGFGFCSNCGGTLARTGSCLSCTSCGQSGGCG